jgi:NAD-reducing hydrogenase small subunit
MSFLDLDERLIELAARVTLTASPVTDLKEFPEVDVVLVEGALAQDEHVEQIRQIRERAKVLIAFGDCAVTGNVTALRNLYGLNEVLDRAYRDTAATVVGLPAQGTDVPRLLPRVLPLHHVVTVDRWLPGCPPSADAIWEAITELLDGSAGPAPDDAPVRKFG